jgi:AbrB family looped-hinge helix DNA binding protein
MISAKLSSKFQLVIPKAIRNQLDLKAGQQFTFIIKGDVIDLAPIRSLAAARGSFKGCNPSGYREITGVQ